MRTLLLLVALALTAGVQAQGTLEVITLRYRTADQVMPVLRPLLEPGGALSGQYNQLIVRTSAGNLSQLRSILDAIDQPARRLTISVRFDATQDSSRSGVQGGALITNRGLSANVRIDDSRASLDERVDQRIQVMEGGRALVSSGETRPLRQRQVIQTPTGPVIQETTVMQGAATGFEVIPRVSGSTVFLEIAPQREQFAPGSTGVIQSERVASTVSGRLGDWIDLGGASSASTRSGSGILSSREASATGNRSIWVKVEELR